MDIYVCITYVCMYSNHTCIVIYFLVPIGNDTPVAMSTLSALSILFLNTNFYKNKHQTGLLGDMVSPGLDEAKYRMNKEQHVLPEIQNE